MRRNVKTIAAPNESDTAITLALVLGLFGVLSTIGSTGWAATSTLIILAAVAGISGLVIRNGTGDPRKPEARFPFPGDRAGRSRVHRSTVSRKVPWSSSARRSAGAVNSKAWNRFAAWVRDFRAALRVARNCRNASTAPVPPWVRPGLGRPARCGRRPPHRWVGLAAVAEDPSVRSRHLEDFLARPGLRCLARLGDVAQHVFAEQQSVVGQVRGRNVTLATYPARLP